MIINLAIREAVDTQEGNIRETVRQRTNAVFEEKNTEEDNQKDTAVFEEKNIEGDNKNDT